jgi:outer membrane protein assembly factor BamB
LIYHDRLYLVDDDGVLRCLNPEDGSELWRERLGAPVAASLVAGADRIYVTGESGRVFVIAADDKFSLLAKNSLNEVCLATPAIAGDSLFIRGQQHLFCFSTESDQGTPLGDDATVNTVDAASSPSDLPVGDASNRPG